MGADDRVIGRGYNAPDAPVPKHERQPGAVRGGVHGKFVVHAEMAALRQALEASGGQMAAVRGACVYVARLAAMGEHYEDAAPCEKCDAVLRACGVQKALWTATEGAVRICDYCSDAQADAQALLPSEEHCQWMGIPHGWAT